MSIKIFRVLVHSACLKGWKGGQAPKNIHLGIKQAIIYGWIQGNRGKAVHTYNRWGLEQIADEDNAWPVLR